MIFFPEFITVLVYYEKYLFIWRDEFCMVIGRINRDLNIPHLDNDTLHARGIPKNLITSIIDI
jgi:hypothetical protein